jgi:peptidoglycan/xylan/chitin deacetylase (PgdA/CDA1 family)
MNLFLAENKPLTLGIVMNHVGRNQAVMEKILEGKDKGLFELALHGYEHVYYNKLSPQEQLNQLSNANQRMQDLFGKPSEIFIPPYDIFNNYTIDAMTKLGIRIISAGDWDYGTEFGNSQYKLFYANDAVVDDKDNDPSKDNNNSHVIHIPRDAGFESFDAPQPTLVPIKQILNETNSHIQIFGYSVIVMHPESFQVMQNGKYTKTVDGKEINNLKTLIDSIKSKNIHITSFSKLTSPVLNS